MSDKTFGWIAIVLFSILVAVMYFWILWVPLLWPNYKGFGQ